MRIFRHTNANFTTYVYLRRVFAPLAQCRAVYGSIWLSAPINYERVCSSPMSIPGSTPSLHPTYNHNTTYYYYTAEFAYLWRRRGGAPIYSRPAIVGGGRQYLKACAELCSCTSQLPTRNALRTEWLTKNYCVF